MTVRHFDGVDDFIQFSPGGMIGTDGGPMTVLMLVNPDSLHAGWLIQANTASGEQWGINPFSDGNFYFGFDGGAGGFANLGGYTAGDWQILGATRSDGASQMRKHYVNKSLGAAWQHASVGGILTDSVRVLDAFTIGRTMYSGDRYQGSVAVAGLWNRVLADEEIEALEFGLQSWVDSSPRALWRFDQTSELDAITDLTLNGADQSNIVGTSVLEGDDPPNFSFVITPIGVDLKPYIKQTDAFINENPISIKFRRRTKLATPEGGYTLNGEVLGPTQKARLVQSGRVASADMRSIPDGRVVNIEATLVMPVGADVRLYDLVDIPAHSVGGDPELAGQWEVGQISGRWATNAGIFRHAS